MAAGEADGRCDWKVLADLDSLTVSSSGAVAYVMATFRA